MSIYAATAQYVLKDLTLVAAAAAAAAAAAVAAWALGAGFVVRGTDR